MEFIVSKDNETFKKIKKLKTKKYRDLEKMFIAEGIKFLDFNKIPEIIVISEKIKDEENIQNRLNKFDCKKIVINEKLFSQLTSQENSQGIIIVYKSEEPSTDKMSDNIIVLNKICDPGNLGTIIRVADSAGFKDILITKGSVDHYNEKVVRSSMGSIFNINIYYIEETELVKFLKTKQYNIISTALESDSVPYTDMCLLEKNAIIFGNEGNGIEASILKESDQKIIIPIYGTAESLNVAMASGIILYEIRNKIIKRGK